MALTWLSPFSAASCQDSSENLGTLVVAATDGVVHLLPLCLPASGTAPVVTSSQWISLGVPPTAIDPNALQRFGFPNCVECRPEFPHLVVAGFNTGYVALWSLTTFCPWLDEYRYIPSIRCFRGSNGPIFSVALDPLSGRNILCSGEKIVRSYFVRAFVVGSYNVFLWFIVMIRCVAIGGGATLSPNGRKF